MVQDIFQKKIDWSHMTIGVILYILNFSTKSQKKFANPPKTTYFGSGEWELPLKGVIWIRAPEINKLQDRGKLTVRPHVKI